MECMMGAIKLLVSAPASIGSGYSSASLWSWVGLLGHDARGQRAWGRLRNGKAWSPSLNWHLSFLVFSSHCSSWPRKGHQSRDWPRTRSFAVLEPKHVEREIISDISKHALNFHEFSAFNFICDRFGGHDYVVEIHPCTWIAPGRALPHQDCYWNSMASLLWRCFSSSEAFQGLNKLLHDCVVAGWLNMVHITNSSCGRFRSSCAFGKSIKKLSFHQPYSILHLHCLSLFVIVFDSCNETWNERMKLSNILDIT